MSKIKRPINGITYKLKHSCGSAFLTINHSENNIPKEVFYRATSGTCSNCTSQAIAVLISFLLSEISEEKTDTIRKIGKKLTGFSCPHVRIDYENGQPIQITSCIDTIGRTLLSFADEHNL